MLQQKSGSSNRGSSSSQQGATLAVLQSEHTLQWTCLNTVESMLAQFLLQAKPASAGSSGAAAAPGRRHNQQRSASSSTSTAPLHPEASASSMPAAYSSMLEQLGCSREVGLWLAMIEVKNEGYRVGRGDSFRWMEPLRVAVMRDLHIYSKVGNCLITNDQARRMVN
jgi:hypothetical protein